MKTLSRWYKVVLIAILFAIGLLLLNLMNLFGSEGASVSAPIPEDAGLVVRIDAKTFWQKGMYSVVFESENDTTIHQEIKSLIDKKYIKRSSDLLPVDINKDIVGFTMQHEGRSYVVVAFQLTNVAKFMKVTSDRRTSSNWSFTVGKTGYLISGPISTSRSALRQLESKIRKSPKVNFDELGNRSDFITFNSGKKAKRNKFSLGIQQATDNFKLKGSIEGAIDFTPLKYGVKQQGVALTVAHVPDQLNAHLQNYLPFLNGNKVTGFSLDYDGANISDKIEGLPAVVGMLPLPNMNAVFRFERKLQLDSLMTFFPEAVRTETGVKLHDTEYTIELLDEYHLFVGIDKKSVVNGSPKTLFALKGTLPSLTKFDGGFIVVAVLTNLKPVKSFTDFSNATEPFTFSITQKDAKHYTIDGKLPFRDGKNSINEMVKLILSLGIIR